ncbi:MULTISPECIES: TetR/AcrR family transcriptional regulator [unclassified Sphingomonas]|uniref:TetR/AcrR family transcriptional regulator n=1 Tax=unclassified Sphingomonas TaxID=196159 RepID=UPI00082DBD97|nr:MULTISPECIES: TetR/AcrR family transcriptional regulator [unclassified Sphingomonas]
MDKGKSVIARRRKAAKDDSTASYQNRRQEITEAAVHVFHRLGYAKASLSAIAADLGIDRASIYYYFSSKEDVFDEIVRTVLEENEALARRIAESSISPARKLRDLVSALMVSYAENYPLLYIYVKEDLTSVSGKRSEWSDHMRQLNRSIERCFITIVEQGYADGGFRRIGSPRTVAAGILGMLNWSHRWFRPDRSEPAEEIGKTFAELVISGLESPYSP